jgi:hypothetical protein
MKSRDSARQNLATGNRKHTRMRWGAQLNQVHLSTLWELSMQFGFSLAMGEVMLLVYCVVNSNLYYSARV